MRLTFFCPSNRRPVGGIKVIYRLAQLCDELLGNSGEARVLHPNQPWTRYTWFDSRPKLTRKLFRLRWEDKPALTGIGKHFSADKDIVVLPEIWVRKYGKQLADRGIPFAILVQGGYLLAKGKRSDLDQTYAAAKLILSVSDNTQACIEQAFPFTSGKIRRLCLHVDASKFSPSAAKENLISFMPRKLPDHISLWKFFLAPYLPSHWKLRGIEGLSEQGVAELLSKSRIFLSTSHLEGLGLPPIEAALAGNLVLGYTGEGGKEYWHPPLFHPVPHGDLVTLANKTIALTRELDRHDAPPLHEARQALAARFSEEAHRHSVEQFLNDLLA